MNWNKQERPQHSARLTTSITRNTYLFATGIDNYLHLPSLSYPEREIRRLVDQFQANYSCKIFEHAPPLFGENATKDALFYSFKALARYFQKRPYQDNLIVLFSGQSSWDPEFQEGAWALPSAKKEGSLHYISYAEIQWALSNIPAHHSLIISHSRLSPPVKEPGPERSEEAKSLHARWILGLGEEKNLQGWERESEFSPFASGIMEFLDVQNGEGFFLHDLSEALEQHMINKGFQQTIVNKPIEISGHQGGEFWLPPAVDLSQQLRLLKKGHDPLLLAEFIRQFHDSLKEEGMLEEANLSLVDAFQDHLTQTQDPLVFLTYLEENGLIGENTFTEVFQSLREIISQLHQQNKNLTETHEVNRRELDEWKQEEELLRQALEETKEKEAKLQAQIQKLKSDLLSLKEEHKDQKISLHNPNVMPQYLGNIRIDMVRVEGGKFRLAGNIPAQVATFEIGKYPVTQKEWRVVMGEKENPSYFEGEQNDLCPVERVSWEDCQMFIQKLNQLTGLHYRLPTEIEWEFAAIGGNHSRNFLYAGGMNMDDLGWYGNNSGRKTNPVGKKSSNELGLYDVSGNVMEWCQDWYQPYPSVIPPNYRGPLEGNKRILRGGSWKNGAASCKPTDRNYRNPRDSWSNVGFRLARNV